MKPDPSRTDRSPGSAASSAHADALAAVRRDARAAVVAIVGLTGRLADPGLPAADRVEAASAVRKHCRRLLRMLGGQDPATRTEAHPPAVPRPRVLVAEDCPDSRQAVCSFLSHAGFDVTPAENGRVAVALSRAGKFDLVLLDMQMPEVDGYEAARQLRGDGFRGPVIALTGDVQPGDEQACHEAGCDEYLAKPWDPKHLMKVVAAHLKAKRQRPKADSVRPTVSADPTLRQLAREFASSVPRTVSEIATAFAARDRAQVAKLAHQMSGAGGLFGFPELCQAARQLEHAVKVGNEDDSNIDQRVRALAELSRRIARSLGEQA
jgi:CheY-like chemotaxis protein